MFGSTEISQRALDREPMGAGVAASPPATGSPPRIEIDRFEVEAVKHPDADANELAWKVLVKVRFRSENPQNWGEFRAYGAQWTRVINRTHTVRDFMADEEPELDPKLKSQPRRHEVGNQLETGTHLPFWGLTQGPRRQDGLAWRLGNDQHMNILYAKVVPGVPRSDQESKKELPDDDNAPDKLLGMDDPEDFDGLDAQWHIIARDEPSYRGLQMGDFVEYWHRGEFQIRDPVTKQVLPLKKQMFLRVSGRYPAFVYSKSLDSTTLDLPPFWEASISALDTPREDYYPERGITIARPVRHRHGRPV
jgi:hypothetical protein